MIESTAINRVVIKNYFVLILLLSVASNISSAQHRPYEEINDSSLVGRLWLPDSAISSPGILLIGGSGGGYENQDAKWLASAGFVVFNVRYFGAKGLPENLVEIPIEYFNKAIDWLQNHPSVKNSKIGIFAHSRGTEAAILVSHYNPVVEAVVLRSPSAVVWSGLGWKGYNQSAWTWDEKPIPFLNVGLIDGAVWLLQVLLKHTLIKTRHMFNDALDQQESVQKALLPVEDIHADLLLISGADDQQWPSSLMADMLIAVLRESNVNFSYHSVVFENAGHRPGYLSEPDDTFANGGTIEGNLQAHIKTKVIVKDFFDRTLR